ALCSTTRSLRSLPSEIAMHRVVTTDRYPSPTRRGATAHATTGHAGSDAAATSHRGTSIRQFEIPHLRTSALPAAWTARGANGNQSGRIRLQSEAHGEHSRRTQATCSPAGHLILHTPVVTRRQRDSPRQNKKTMLRYSEHRSKSLHHSRFVTVWFGVGFDRSHHHLQQGAPS